MSSDMVGVLKKIAVEAVEANKPVAVCFGTVMSESPLQIQTDQKITLTDDLLILTDNVKDIQRDITFSMETEEAEIEVLYHNHSYSGTTSVDNYTNTNLGIDYDHSHTYSGSTSFYGSKDEISHKHLIKGKKKVIVHNGLKTGEYVILIRCNSGQRYVVLDRVGDFNAKGEWIDDT